MKSVQPDMNVGKQTRKAVAQITFDLGAENTAKAFYGLYLLNQMLDSIEQGQPRPWSEFEPMLKEEFG